MDPEEPDKKKIILKEVIITSIVLIILISTTLFFYNINGDSFDFSDSELYIVPTGSMDGGPTDYPISTVPKDSMVMVHRLSDEQKEELVVGDVITFHQDRLLKVHRIVRINDDGTFVTKGDANSSEDAPITSSDITGKVVGVSVYVGKAVNWARDIFYKSPVFILLGIMLIIAIIFSVIEIVKIMNEKPEDQEGEINGKKENEG